MYDYQFTFLVQNKFKNLERTLFACNSRNYITIIEIVSVIVHITGSTESFPNMIFFASTREPSE